MRFIFKFSPTGLSVPLSIQHNYSWHSHAFVLILVIIRISHKKLRNNSKNLNHAEPCSSYTLITGQYKQSNAYTLKSTDTAVNDNFLSEGWYRFDSGAGNDMATQAPAVTQCGTIYPILMQGMCQFKKKWISRIVLEEVQVLIWFGG